ncbi:MAG: flagellar motor switch protein FliG [Gammaproteobacteria bacterium]|jgi:flagellar motor switch protein FliG
MGEGRLNNDVRTINGVRRAAIVLMALGEDCASQILRHLGPREVQILGYEMTQVKKINRDLVTNVLSEFATAVEQYTDIALGTEDYVRNVLMQALGEDKAGNLMDRIVGDNNKKGLEAFRWMDARSIAELLRFEHPQIIAIVLSYLEYDQAADVVAMFPDHLRSDVLLRVASIDSIQPEALQELNDIMETQFAGRSNVKTSSIGGVKSAAQILNHMDGELETEIIDNIREINPDVGQSIQELMFEFSHLENLIDRDIQKILREISSESLVVALKGASHTVREKIYKNMSRRAAAMLQDDLETKGPVKVKDVENAQKEILLTVRRLADAGDISLRARDVDEYI